ncbi:class I SAM-dependent methyltransferase [Nocardia arthritidis]|uniref:Methyltransferase domain-containing protein n=1 Tax=Nocardia arthritidis TaxID=228602 RepID=A0A6G9YQA7_9NOCA|nr:methyltransferase domain-containing protein [Nocardia arthritidis]
MTYRTFGTDWQRQLPKDTAEIVTQALAFAERAHGAQTRPAGEPYVEHLREAVAVLVDGVGRTEPDLLVAAVLHDVVEDTPVTLAEVRAEFGDAPAELVYWVTRDPAQEKSAYLKRFAAAPDDAVLVKLADRLSNVQRLHTHPRPAKRAAYFAETVEFILPLAARHPWFADWFAQWRTAMEARLAQADSFGEAAAAYAKARPSYPNEAVRWLIPPKAGLVLDLGAGTGQLTRAVLAAGFDVVAVEPSAGMRAELRRAHPNVPIHAGTAERIPLPDNAVDAVVVGQAWHWVDVAVAVPEIARILRPGGQLGLVWNIRDERHDWVAELGRIMHRGIEQDMGSENPRVGAPFTPIERRDFEWTYHLSRADLLDLVASRSYVITMEPQQREQVLAEVTELLHTHPDLKGRDTLELPYRTRCSRTVTDLSVDRPEPASPRCAR